MFYFILKRITQSFIVLVLLSIVVFKLLSMMPDEALIQFKLENNPTEEQLEQYKKERGLDQPFVIQYKKQMIQLLTWDFGYSERFKVPVTQLFNNRIPTTLKLTVPVFLLTIIIALPIGILTAVYHYSKLDYTINFLIFIGISAPTFWIGLLAIYLFSLKLQIFPASGIQTINVNSFLDQAKYYILPILVLSIHGIGNWVRYFRGTLLEVLSLDYIRTARAKGLSEDQVILKHAVRNALIPVLTLVALSVAYLFSGALITEQIFGIPGMGQLLIEAVKNSDRNVAFPAFLMIAILTIIFNLLADMLYGFADPRVKKSLDKVNNN